MLTEASTTHAWKMRRCGTVHQCFHHASMEDAIFKDGKDMLTEFKKASERIQKVLERCDPASTLLAGGGNRKPGGIVGEHISY
jgi:hypothetical protein